MLPKNLKYEKNVWILIQEDVAIIGLIKPSVDLSKEFVFVQLPKKGNIKKGQTLISLEAIKWSGEIESPLTGNIIEVNSNLFDEPSIINKDPYGEGWIAKLKIEKKQELKDLLTADQREKK